MDALPFMTFFTLCMVPSSTAKETSHLMISSGNIFAGLNNTISCKAVNRRGFMSLKWTREDGADTRRGSRMLRYRRTNGDYVTELKYTFLGDVTMNRKPFFQFKCIARHKKIQQTAPFLTEIKIIPSDPVISSSSYVSAGKMATFTCISELGKPPAKLSWHLGDRVYNGTTSLSDSKYNTVTVTNQLTVMLKPEDNGKTLHCDWVFQPNAQVKSVNKTLQVHYAPVISLPKKQYFFKENENGKITCVVNANPPVTDFIWTKNKKLLNISSDRLQNTLNNSVMSLFIRNVNKNDTGFYTCTVKNSLGESNSSKISVFLKYLPVVTVFPKVLKLKKGDTAILNCSARSSPSPQQLMWFRNKAGKKDILKIVDLSLTHQPGDSVLVIKSLDLEDSGEYFCQINNGEGLGVEKIQITVTYAPVLTVTTSTYTFRAKRNGSVVCRVSAVPPVTSVAWIKDGVVVNINPVHSKTSTVSLTLTGIQKNDAGVYVCSAENPVGKKTSPEISVIVRYPPIVSVFPTIVRVTEGKTVHINCALQAYPHVQSVTWIRKQGMTSTVLKSTRWSSDNPLIHSALIITNISSSDTGNYLCQAANDEGSSQTKTIIRVRYIPKATRNDTLEIKALVGESVILSCPVKASPKAYHFRWRFEKKILKNTKQHLKINVSVSSFGHYSCSATNSMGTSNPVNITLTYRTNSTRRVQKTVLAAAEGENLVLNCSVTDSASSANFSWKYQNQKLNVTSKNLNITVSSTTVGVYLCQAVNPEGIWQEMAINLQLNKGRSLQSGVSNRSSSVFLPVASATLFLSATVIYAILNKKRKAKEIV